jgi:hypothetical protein
MRLLIALAAVALALPPASARALAAQDGAIATAPPEPGPEATAQASRDAEARYQALLAQAKASAPKSDWLALRLAYAARPAFKPFGQDVAKSEMFKAVEAGDCPKALAEAKAVIAETYVDADAHLIAAFCDDKQGDPAGAVLERGIGVGLLKSIQTGDGLSPASPFTVIDVDEEYALIRARRLKVTSQALIQQDGHSYDALTTMSDKGESATYYFLIDRALAAETAALKPGAVSEGGPPDRGP